LTLGSQPAGGHSPTRGPPRPGWHGLVSSGRAFQSRFRGNGMHLRRATPAAPPRDPGDVPTRRAGTELGGFLMAAGDSEYEHRTITDQFPLAELPTARKKTREEESPNAAQMRGSAWHRAARWNRRRRRPTNFATFPAPLFLRASSCSLSSTTPTLYYSITEPTR
jgi:hypothetical protein